MNYRKIYENIIERAKIVNVSKKEGIYYEKHHIRPKSIGGTDKDENIVILTAREHFIAHWVLCRLYPKNDKLLCAWNRMTSGNYNNGERYNSHAYEYARNLFVKYLKRTCLVIDKEGNIIRVNKTDPLIGTEFIKWIQPIEFGRIYIHNEKINKRVKKEQLEEYLNNGWKLGDLPKRKHDFVTGFKTINNTHEIKKVPKIELQKYLNEGWKLGAIKSSTKNTTWINNGIENKMVVDDILNSYMKKGWVRGIIRKNNETRIHVNNGKKEYRIPLSKLSEYEQNGWTKGRITKPCADMAWMYNEKLKQRKRILNHLVKENLKDDWQLGFKKVFS